MSLTVILRILCFIRYSLMLITSDVALAKEETILNCNLIGLDI